MANDCLCGKEVIFLKEYWDDIVCEGIEDGVFDKEDFFQDKNDSFFQGVDETIEAEPEQQELQIVRAYHVSQFVLCVSSIIHKIIKGEIHEGVNSWQEKDGTQITFVLNRNSQAPLSAFDMAVYTAVVSLIAEEIDTFSTATVCRTLCLNPRMSKVSAYLQYSVEASLKKMAAIEVEIFKLPVQGQGERYKGKLLELESFLGRTENGITNSFWRSRRIPILYQYCKAVRHIWKRPLHLVQTEKEFSNTLNAIKIRYCLLRRVAIISRMTNKPYRDSNKIDYDALLKEVGMVDSQSSKRELHRISKACLRCWKERGLIKDYQIYKKKRKNAGVSIEAQPILT